MSDPSPAWRYTSPMNFSREDHQAIILPDGRVLVAGGVGSSAVRPTEIFDPTTETWTVVASLQSDRGYHSTAVLLPDGRVLEAGANGNRSREIYSPPYLFRGRRPMIDAAPPSVEYGETFTLPTADAASITSVVLMRPGASTHAFNMEQRYVPLTFTHSSQSSLEVTAPSEPNIAPVGYYMLFVVADGIPSTAPFVLLRPSTGPTASATPTVAATVTATPTMTITPAPTATPTQTRTPALTPTETPTRTRTATPTRTATKTVTPTRTRTATPTRTATLAPTAVATSSPVGTIDLGAAADTYVEAGTEASWDHGLSDHLDVDLSPERITYLRFDLRGVNAPVQRATLTLWCRNASGDGGTLYPVANAGFVEGNGTGIDSRSANGPGLKWIDVDTNRDGTIDRGDTSPFVPGGPTATATPTASATASPTATATPTASATASSTPTATPTVAATESSTPTAVATASSTPTVTPTESSTPTPTQTATPAMTPTPDLVAQGARIFFQETFAGNGRTCGTCHPAAANFTLNPAFIAALPPNDPLFVAETNPALAELENPGLMRSRALILENIDGFDQPPVFRGVPHIFDQAFTEPFGWSGSFDSLRDFAVQAVIQHFPLTLNRVAGVDFRAPTEEELDALEAFMLSVFLPRDQSIDLDSFVISPAQQRGRDLFFNEAKCAECHSGLVLEGVAVEQFNNGVVNLPANTTPPPECNPPCPALGPLEAGGRRKFDTPPLFGLKNTAPFFHDNSVPTLREAVEFYAGAEFNQSPGGLSVGGIALTPLEIDDITAFLEALTTCGDGVVNHGEQCDDANQAVGDGCRPNCTIEACGDGIVDPQEQCDDGNLVDRDGCDPSCAT